MVLNAACMTPGFN